MKANSSLCPYDGAFGQVSLGWGDAWAVLAGFGFALAYELTEEMMAREPTQAALRDNELEVLRLLQAAAADSPAGGAGHPHIANMLEELGDHQAPHQHAVLEYCAGGTLKRHLQSLQTSHPDGMCDEVVSAATRQLAAALFHLHYLGIAHGDLKPANV